MINIFKIDNRLSQITDIQREPSTQNIIVHAYAIAEEESETDTCVQSSPFHPLLESLLYNSTPTEVFTKAKSVI